MNLGLGGTPGCDVASIGQSRATMRQLRVTTDEHLLSVVMFRRQRKVYIPNLWHIPIARASLDITR